MSTDKPPHKPTAKPGSKTPGKAATKFAAIKSNRGKHLRIVVVLGAVLIGLTTWLITRDSSDAPTTEPAEPRIVSEAELAEAATTLGQPIYWAGEVPGTEIELTELPEGGTQVRYLPEGEDHTVEVLTLGSYPLADPDTALKEFAQRQGSTTRHSKDGREVVTSVKQPTSVYFSSSDNKVQVEVYDPSPQKAMELSLSGEIQPIG